VGMEKEWSPGHSLKTLIFLAALILGVLLMPAGAYFYFARGYAPVATTAAPMPFEKLLARTALHARLATRRASPSPSRTL
jgi:hypothetical protein